MISSGPGGPEARPFPWDPEGQTEGLERPFVGLNCLSHGPGWTGLDLANRTTDLLEQSDWTENREDLTEQSYRAGFNKQNRCGSDRKL